MTRISMRHLGLAAGALLLAGSVIPFVASAQQAGGGATAPAPVAGQQAGKQRQGSYLAQLAATLGVPEQKLRDAVVQTRARLAARRLAPALGLPADRVEAGLQQGKTLAQIGAENGKTRDTLRSALVAAREQRLQQAVTKGRLTAEQANLRRQRLVQRVETLLDRNFQQLGTRKRT